MSHVDFCVLSPPVRRPMTKFQESRAPLYNSNINQQDQGHGYTYGHRNPRVTAQRDTL